MVIVFNIKILLLNTTLTVQGDQIKIIYKNTLRLEHLEVLIDKQIATCD